MPKRFTDTEKWKKKFIRSLPPKYKLLWFYILDDCDHGGIWHPDFEVASIRISEEVNQIDSELFFKDQIEIFDDGEKWFIPAFIEFQYGELNSNNRAHNSVINILKKYKLGSYKDHISTLKGLKDKDKDKDKDKSKLKNRKNEFWNYLKLEFNDQYPHKMLKDFYEYWSEHGIKDTKMRFEKEKVFGTSRRLSTWQNRSKVDYSKNDINFNDQEMKKHEL